MARRTRCRGLSCIIRRPIGLCPNGKRRAAIALLLMRLPINSAFALFSVCEAAKVGQAYNGSVAGVDEVTARPGP
eukprot:12308305-Heterocapsa_arctica.AAC.1